jgi:hypothetical protein
LIKKKLAILLSESENCEELDFLSHYAPDYKILKKEIRIWLNKSREASKSNKELLEPLRSHAQF